jgi:glycyl-tRNA synthetase
MSIQLYPISALRSWNEDEIEYREFIIKRVKNLLFNKLSNINPAWKFYRCETPSLVPLSDVSDEYDNSDLFLLKDFLGKDTPAVMRPETTQGSYHYANYIIGKGNQRSLKKLPICVWQAGQSHRRETNDGATAKELRYNQFWQLEFQCIYRNNSLANYREAIQIPLAVELGYLCRKDIHVVESDRIPSYSTNTQDIEAFYNDKWKEVCSISTRTDFSDDCKVLEIAIGLDRVMEISKIGD